VEGGRDSRYDSIDFRRRKKNGVDIFRGLYRCRPFPPSIVRGPAMISAGLETTRRNFVNEHAVSRFTRAFLLRRGSLASRCSACVLPREPNATRKQHIGRCECDGCVS